MMEKKRRGCLRCRGGCGNQGFGGILKRVARPIHLMGLTLCSNDCIFTTLCQQRIMNPCFNARRTLSSFLLFHQYNSALLYRSLRSKGVTFAKPKVCQIAFYAMHFKLDLVHNDIDFVKIAKHTSLKGY